MLPSHNHSIMASHRVPGGAWVWQLEQKVGNQKTLSSVHALLETLCMTLSKSCSLSILLGISYRMWRLRWHRGVRGSN